MVAGIASRSPDEELAFSLPGDLRYAVRESRRQQASPLRFRKAYLAASAHDADQPLVGETPYDGGLGELPGLNAEIGQAVQNSERRPGVQSRPESVSRHRQFNGVPRKAAVPQLAQNHDIRIGSKSGLDGVYECFRLALARPRSNRDVHGPGNLEFNRLFDGVD